MSESIESKKKKARLRFFRNDSGELVQFLGAFAYKFAWDVHTMSQAAEGYVLLDVKDRGDGVIHINEEFIKKDDYTFGNLCFLVSHECLHILNKHGVRRNRRDPKLWNVACDHCVDRDLSEIKAFAPYHGQYNVVEKLNQEQPKCTAEQAYTWLMKNTKRVSVQFNPQTGMLEVEDMSNGKKWTVNPQTGGADDEKLSPEERETLRQITEQCLTEARSLHQGMKMKGNSGGEFAEYLENLLKVEIPWQYLLEKAIKTNVQMVMEDLSWSSPNKFLRPLGITLPGAYLSESKDVIGTLAIGIDTSGSIDKETLKEFAGIIYESMRFFEKVLVIVHDVQIHQVKEFDKDNIAEFYEFVEKEGFKGRGGTSHSYLFEYMERKIWDDDEKRDELSMFISLTDGYSDIEGIWGNYKFLKNSPCVFLIDGDHELNFGTAKNIDVIHIKKDKDN